MNYLSQILFFFGAIGAFNSFILALYLLLSKSYSRLQNRLFSLFLFALSLRILHSLFYAFSTSESVWSIQFGPSYFLLIAPLLFSYIVSASQPVSFWVKNWKYHILFWITVVFCFMAFLPFKKNIVLIKETILPIIYVQWLVYILMSVLFVVKTIEGKKKSLKTKWLVSLLVVNLIIWMSFALLRFDYFITGSIIFSILFYSFLLFFLFNKKTASEIFQKYKKANVSKNNNKTEKFANELNEIMTTQKLYINPDLKLPDVANHLNVSAHELSRLLNENIGESFTEYINKYRINEAKSLIKANTKYTIEAIGVQSGFNSKSAFYKAFKKFTDLTPAKYKSQL